jgi:8-oxo-dGTP pyrophosphatase MutT (NUDIX family)
VANDRAERARRFLAESPTPVTPRDASTVLVLRDGDQGPEVFMMRRHQRMAFGPGMFVFPGGSVDARDVVDPERWFGPSPAAWAERLACGPDLAAALVSAAVRETFEESGVLFAGPDGGHLVATAPSEAAAEAWERDRRGLVDHRLGLDELLARRGLVLRSDLLRPAGRWITPVFSPRRYDTRFFVAALPAGAQCRDFLEENDTSCWVTARDALRGRLSGAMPMMLATADALRHVARHHSVAEVLAATPPSSEPRIVRAEPDGDGVRFFVDGLGEPLAEHRFIDEHLHSVLR